LIHHDRKSGGEQFTGSRGSGALPSFVETIIEFRRHGEDTKDPKRVLNGKGRYRDTPDKKLIELTEAGYVSHGDPDDAGVRATFTGTEWRDAAMRLIPVGTPGMNGVQVRKALGAVGTGVREEVIREWLKQRFEDGELGMTGKGVKGDPWRYYRFPPVNDSPTLRAGVGDASGDDSDSVE